MTKPKAKSAVHRHLNFVSPSVKGADVRALQQGINKELRHRKLEWRTAKVDGQLGPQTQRAAAFLAWVVGLAEQRRDAIRGKNGRPAHISENVQRILRDASKRSILDKGRERTRRQEVREIRHKHSTGPMAAIAYIEKQAAKDVHEVGDTNTGPMVDKWESYFGLHEEPWCGCLAGYAAKVIGGSTAMTWFPYGPSIMADAKAGRNGVYEVSFDEIEGGEILVLWNGEHVVTAAGKSRGDSIKTGEGNTSPNPGGDQTNGGSVEMKTRSRSDVSCVARVYG